MVRKRKYLASDHAYINSVKEFVSIVSSRGHTAGDQELGA